MQKIADVSFAADALMLSGELDFSNVRTIYNKAQSKLADYRHLIFDFSGVTSSNSAALALIVEWIKYAKKQNKPIQFKHLSKDILSIAAASGLDELIEVA